MYSSVKEHQLCVNTSSSVCHMDRFLRNQTRGKEEASFPVDSISLNGKRRHKREHISYVCLPDFSGHDNDSMTHDLSEVNSGGRLESMC